MHNPRPWIILALAILAALVGCDSGEMVVTMTRDEIQARVSPRFPITKNWLFVSVVLREPEIFLPEGTNQIGINMRADVNIPLLKTMTGHLGATAVPRYDSELKSLYLDQATVERLDLPELLPGLQVKARSAIESVARQELARHPIFEYKGNNLKEITVAHALKEVQVRDGKLRAIFALAL